LVIFNWDKELSEVEYTINTGAAKSIKFSMQAINYDAAV
jgi:hypothetical protein